jgi:hypothetical protein
MSNRRSILVGGTNEKGRAAETGAGWSPPVSSEDPPIASWPRVSAIKGRALVAGTTDMAKLLGLLVAGEEAQV